MGPGFCPEFGCRALPAQGIWQGSSFAADQTNAMLATSNGGDKSSRKRKPLRLLGTASFAEKFAIYSRKTRCFFCWLSRNFSPFTQRFFAFPCGGYHLPSGCCGCVGTTPRGVVSAEKTAFSEWVLCADGCVLFPPAHSAFSALLCGGWYHYPRRALHAVETLDAQELRRRIRRFYAAAEFALCGLNLPSSGTHATPTPNRAHSGSHAETRGVFTA